MNRHPTLSPFQALAVKSFKSTVRNSSTRSSILISLGSVFGILLFIFYATREGVRHHEMRYQHNFDRLQLRFQCERVPEADGSTSIGCTPHSIASVPSSNESHSRLGSLPVGWAKSTSINALLDRNDAPVVQLNSGARDVLDAVAGALLLRGGPVLGLDAWVSASDAVAAATSREAREDVLRLAALRAKLINLLDVRRQRLLFSPPNCFTQAFVEFLAQSTHSFQFIPHDIVRDYSKADLSDVWAVIEMEQDDVIASSPKHRSDAGGEAVRSASTRRRHLQGPYTRSGSSTSNHKKTTECLRQSVSVTISMHALAAPDTRNFRWDPRFSGPMSSLDSGHAMYVLSGFLTLQWEVQRFLASLAPVPPQEKEAGTDASDRRNDTESNKNDEPRVEGCPEPASDATDCNHRSLLLGGDVASSGIPPGLLNLLSSLRASSRNGSRKGCIGRGDGIPGWSESPEGGAIETPLLLRAFEMPPYTENIHWHKLGNVIVSVLVILFSLPAALLTHRLWAEIREGQMDLMLSFPGFRVHLNVLSWSLVAAAVLLLWSLCSLGYFLVTLATAGASAVIAAVLGLFLCGLAIVPLGVAMAFLPSGVSSPSIAVPSLAFVMTVPGLLYFNLEYDVQRSVLKELCLSLIAPSAATLLLREITAAETLGRAFSIAQTSSAGTPMYAYLIMLGLDVAIYFAVAVYIAEFVADKASCRVLDRTPTRNVSVRTLSVSNITIVGSNGAGKSTLLRIIAGFDSDFGGAVNLLDPQGPAGGLGASSEPRRCIGYCPQGDALFDLLSPEEHVELFLSLLLRPGSEHGQNKEPGGPSKSGEDYLFFERLGLHAVQGKQAGALSGGMRRRLSIAIASLGDPILLVLDEPTTGCDNITKEMIRKWILHMRKTSIVVFSTHLAEDVSVASDHVFLINDRFMCYDDLTSNILMGKLSKRIASPSTEAPLSDHPWLSMEFMTNEKKIMDYLFVCAQRDPAAADYFGTMGLMFGSLGSVSSSATTTAATANPKHIHSIVIPSSMVGFIWGFIRDLETQRVTNWALSSPRVFKTIGRVLENASCACTDMQECKIDRLGPLSDCCAGFKPFGVQSDQFFKILSIRRAELKSRGMQICGTTILTPLIIAFAIASACIQIDFPKLELSKGSIAMRQYGEVLIGDDFSNKPTVNKANLLRNKERLQAIFGGSAKSAEASNSDELLSMLSKSYFTHDRNRFAAVVLEDRLPGFFETVLTIPSSSLNASSLLSVYTQIVAYHREVCGSSSLPQSIQKELLFCDGDNVQYRVWMDGDGVSSNSSISISWLKSVQSNVTLLTNTSTTHALPIFLHDLMPVTYGSQRMSQTSYRLFYQPLRSVNSIDPLNLQRGYTGALILIIYMLLVTSTSGRIISYMKKTGAKHQLHLSGISLVPYWASNLLIDSLLIFVSFMAMLGSVKLCGPPVDDYFFTIPPLGGYFVVILLLAYSPAAVAATYATHVAIASDELKSQVMSVMATVVSSVCFQLFLRADKDNSFHWMEMMLFFLSPSFNFTSVLFEMFSCYGRSMMEHIASSEGIQSSSRFEAYFAARVLMLILQTGIYFATTIFIERDWLYLVTAVKTKYRAGISYVNKQAPIQWRESGDLEQMSLLRGERSARRKDYESTVATTPTTAAGIITHHPFLHTQIIAASNMTVSHDAYSSAPALSSVSLRLMQGERVALIGLNGGGKTTLFRVLSGATDTIPTSGFVEVFGVDPVSEKWSLFGLKSLGYVPQSDGLMEFLTVSETMTLFTNILKQNRPDSDTHEPASNEPVDIQNSRSHGLEMISNRYNDFAVAALSGGNKKKLLMSIATVNSPALLLLDEPTSGIDPDAAHKILDLILRMEANENNGILFASHKIDECLNLCDRIVILAEGSVVYDRTIAEFGARCFLYYTAEIFISKLALESGSTDQLIAQLEGLVCERIGVEKSANCSSIFTRIVSYDDSRLTIMCSKKAVHFSVFWSVLEELRLSGYVGHYGFREPGIEDVLSIHLENPSINIDE